MLFGPPCKRHSSRCPSKVRTPRPWGNGTSIPIATSHEFDMRACYWLPDARARAHEARGFRGSLAVEQTSDPSAQMHLDCAHSESGTRFSSDVSRRLRQETGKPGKQERGPRGAPFLLSCFLTRAQSNSFTCPPLFRRASAGLNCLDADRARSLESVSCVRHLLCAESLSKSHSDRLPG